MVKHTIILGHGEGDPGALGNGTSERAMLEKIGATINSHIKKHKLPIQVISDINVYKRGAVGRYKGTTVTELHYNAFNGTASGTEVLIKSGFKADNIDNRLIKALSKYFKNRGIKSRNNLLNMNTASKLGINYRLVEICFIDSKTDYTILTQKLDLIAQDIIMAILGTKLPSVPTPKPTPAKPTNKMWLVVTGAYSVKANADNQLKEVKKKYPDAYLREV